MKDIKLLVKNYRNIIFVSAGMIILTAVVTYPLVVGFMSILPGAGDTFVYLWSLWWFSYALVSLQQFPLFTNLIFYPMPINISQDVSIVHGMIALPISYFFGPIAAYNFIISITFVLTGIGFYLFLRLLTKHTVASFLGAVIFAFSYYRVFRALIGHLDLASTEWYGFALYFLSRIFVYKQYTWTNYAASALFMALSAYTEYRSFLYFLVFSGVFVAASAIVNGVIEKGRGLYQLGIAYANTLFLLFIFTVPLIAVNVLKVYDTQFVPTYPEYNASFSAYITPPCSIMVSRFLPYCHWSKAWEGNIVYLGIIPLLLAAGYIFRKKAEHEKSLFYIFTIVFVVFILLSLGTKTPLYSWLFDHVSLFRITRVPSRFVIIAEISIAVFGAFAVKKMLVSTVGQTKKFIVAGGILLLLTVEAIPLRVAVTDTKMIPDEHLAVLQPSSEYAVLEVPFGFRSNNYGTFGLNNDISFYYQIKHRIPLIGGYMSMIDGDAWQAMRHNELIQKLMLCQEQQQCVELNGRDREYFNDLFKIRYVIFLDEKHKALERYLVEEFALVPLYEKDKISVWENPEFIQ